MVPIANNFENGSILEEETQLGVLKYTDQTAGMISVSVDDVIVRLFPNPLSTHLSITFTYPFENVEYFVYSIMGNLITKGIVVNEGRIDLTQLECGVYTFVIKYPGENVSYRRIIKNYPQRHGEHRE